MASTLPDKDSPDIHLVVGTPEEIATQTRINSTEWRGALSLDAYLRRETILLQQDLTINGGLTPFMLVYEPPDGGSRQVLCGSETIKKKALISKDGVVTDVVAHGIGSVFCPPEKRGKGYAGRMMEELAKKLRGWQVDEGEEVAFSFLYSDIGKEFYARRGWETFPSAHVSLPPTSNISTEAKFGKKLESKDLAALCEVDEQLIRKRLSNASRKTVALIPDERTLAWHFAREQFVANEIYKKSPTDRGAIVGDRGSRVWCYWMRVWGNSQEKAPNTMHIIRLIIEDDAHSDTTPATGEGVAQVKDSPTVQSIAALLATAQTIASLWDMNEVMLWNPNSAALAAAQSLNASAAVVRGEKESITSLLWYGGGSTKDVDWVHNEKYSWS